METVSGDVVFGGNLRSGGAYSLITHSGDITMGVAGNASAQFRVSLITGELHSAFNLEGSTAASGRRRTQNLRLGSGSAAVELETYSGDIQLVPIDKLPDISTRNPNSSRRRERLDLDDLAMEAHLAPLLAMLGELNIGELVNMSWDLSSKIRVVIPGPNNNRWEDR